MKILKKIVGLVSTILVVGGVIFLFWQYSRNKALFEILYVNPAFIQLQGILEKMGIALLAVILGLVMFVLYMKLGSIVRRNEREKKQAMKAQIKESEEMNRQLKKEAEDAKAEAEEVKKENELMKMTFMRKDGEEPAEEVSEEPEKEENFLKKIFNKKEEKEEEIIEGEENKEQE